VTKRARLLARVHGVDNNGIVWAVEADGTRVAVYNVNHVPTDYYNLLAAAPLMLRAIDKALPMLDTIGKVFESHDLDAHVVPLMQLEAGLNVALIAATDGTFYRR
jgi:hypothetical protein